MNLSVDQTVDQNSLYITKRKGVYYYSRRIPKDLQKRIGKKRIVVSLKTRSLRKAITSGVVLSERLESYWNGIILDEIISQHTSSNFLSTPSRNSLTISDALDLYLSLKGRDKSPVFERTARRNIEQLISLFGDLPITDLTSSDASRYRDMLIERGLASSSIKRSFASIRSVLSLAIQEKGLSQNNPFARVFIPDDNRSKSRPTMPTEIIKKLQAECKELDDANRHLIAIISDTGLRLSEAIGLAQDDIVIRADIPHLKIQEHPWRKLKTPSSKRLVPLVGVSYWAAGRLLYSKSKFAFPKYTNEIKCGANSASAALNKWLKPRVPEGCVVHSFRHGLRDRLRAVECPADISDAIGGWSTSGVGHAYGAGYDLDVKLRWLNKIIL